LLSRVVVVVGIGVAAVVAQVGSVLALGYL
jgi:hypothetical protein